MVPTPNTGDPPTDGTERTNGATREPPTNPLAAAASTPCERPPRERAAPHGGTNPLVTPGTAATARAPQPTPEIMTAQALQYQQQVEKQRKEIESLKRSLSTTRALLQANGIGNTNANVDANSNTNSNDAHAPDAADANTNPSCEI